MAEKEEKEEEAAQKKKIRKAGLIRWQSPMIYVLYGTVPCILGSVYFYGWRSIFVIAVCCAVGFFCEWLFVRTRKEPVTSAVFVTAVLFALTLPPVTPLWVAAIGVIVAVVFGKMAFGGFGFNAFNPALVGRCFIYISFPGLMAMNEGWMKPFTGGGGFAAWKNIDVVTGATPLQHFKDTGALEPLGNLFFGAYPGTFGGPAAILIIFGAVFLLYKKAANWRLMLSAVIGALVFSAVSHYAGSEKVAPPLFTIFSGGLLFASVFMVTEPISAARTAEGMHIFGVMVGALAVLIRSYSGFPEGVTFAVLVGNMFAPIMDYGIRSLKQKRRNNKARSAGEAVGKDSGIGKGQ